MTITWIAVVALMVAWLMVRRSKAASVLGQEIRGLGDSGPCIDGALLVLTMRHQRGWDRADDLIVVRQEALEARRR